MIFYVILLIKDLIGLEMCYGGNKNLMKWSLYGLIERVIEL